MELYLDSVNLDEITAANQLGYVAGLTTTPTFMVKAGIKDIDAQIVKLSQLVNILQVESIGHNAESIVKEAERLIALGLSPKKTVFKIPISLESTKACKTLVDQGFMVNLHLVYTLQQAYMAFCAGATYVCPLVGRLQDQGHDALALVRQCVDVVHEYRYKTKIMFSSVRYPEHIKNALEVGAHAITIPWKIMRHLTENHFTQIGADQFTEDTKLLTKKVSDLVISEHVATSVDAKVVDALVLMTRSQFGIVAVFQPDKQLHRVFTDGDLRKLLQQKGHAIRDMALGDLPAQEAVTIEHKATLYEALALIRKKEVNCLLVYNKEQFMGVVSIHQII